MAGQPTGEGAPQTRVLLLLKGAPGSGKSTLAARLAGALGWPLVDKDDARSSFQHLAPAHPGIDWNALSYEVMWRVVGTQLRCGLSVVVDCPLARRPLFDRAAALAGQVRPGCWAMGWIEIHAPGATNRVGWSIH